MKVLSVLSSLVLVALAIPTSADFVLPAPGVSPFVKCAKYANYASDFVVSSASLTPFIPCPGKPWCIVMTGQLNLPITSGAQISITGRLFARIVYGDTQDMAALMAAAGTPIPYPASAPGTNTTIKLCTMFKEGVFLNLPLQFEFLTTNGNGHVLSCQAANVTAPSDCNQ